MRFHGLSTNSYPLRSTVGWRSGHINRYSLSHFRVIVRTSAYPAHYRWHWLLSESLPQSAYGWHLLRRTERAMRVTSFRLSVCRSFRVKLSTGFSGGQLRPPTHSPHPYPFPFWASPVRVGLFPFTMVRSLVRRATHRHLLAGMTRSDSERTCFSSRFTD